MPILKPINKGLTANDRSESDKEALGSRYPTSFYYEPVTQEDLEVTIPNRPTKDELYTASLQEKYDKEQLYYKALEQYQEEYRIGQNAINTVVNKSIKDVADKVSPYYSKFKNTDYIKINDEEWKSIAAQYQAITTTSGIDQANNWLNRTLKDEVANNQEWYEQYTLGLLGIGSSFAGSAISLWGNIKGAGNYILGDYEDNENLNGWNNFLNSVIDNETTRFGNDVIQYGTLFHLDEAKKEGLSKLEIVQTEDQENSIFNATTVPLALQQGGFTALSMLTGWGTAKVAGALFGGIKLGATKAMPMLYKGLTKTEQLRKLNTVLKGVKRAEQATNAFAIPGIVGTQEGLINGLETKLNVLEEGRSIAYNNHQQFIDKLVDKKVSDLVNQGKVINENDIKALYQQTWDEHKDKLTDAMSQVEHDATISGINTMYLNSAVNGVLNATLMAGLQAPTVQKALQQSKLFGWASPKTKFKVTGSGASTTVKPKMGKLPMVYNVLKEPAGEFTEEYLQTLIDASMTAFGTTNINDFIEKRYKDGNVQVGDYLGNGLSAAWTAFKETATDKEAIKAGVMGAISSIIGTVGPVRRTTAVDKNGKVIRDAEGNVVKTLFGRGLNAEGNVESGYERLSRITPWRSGALSAWNKSVREEKANMRTAEALQNWLRDPTNKAKFDGISGTLAWSKSMHEAGLNNDRFSYKNSVLGKTINDVLMLKKIEGTEYYDTVVEHLVNIANMEEDSDMARQAVKAIRDNVNNIQEKSESDKTIIDNLKKRANEMLDIMDKISKESDNIDALLGEVDEDVKQSLIFSQLQLEDWKKRKEDLQNEISKVNIRSSVDTSTPLTKEQQQLASQYVTIQEAQKERIKLFTKVNNIEKDIERLEKRNKLTDKEKKILKEKKAILKVLEKQLKKLEAVLELDPKGNYILNEEEIMALDPIHRAEMLFRGKKKHYIDPTDIETNKRKKEIELEISVNEEGIKNTEHEELKNVYSEKIEQLKQEYKTLEDKKTAYYNDEQQAVIDNLIQEGTLQDKNFLDNVIDLGRIEASMQTFYNQYNSILSDPESYTNYVHAVKQAAADAATREKFEAINNISDYDNFSLELDKVIMGSSEREQFQLISYFKDTKNAFFDRYMSAKTNAEKVYSKIMEKIELTGQEFDDNEYQMLDHTISYLTNKGVDLKDKNAIFEELTKTDENGLLFAQYIEKINESVPLQSKVLFTSVEEAMTTLNNLMDEIKLDEEQQESINREVKVDTTKENRTIEESPAANTEQENKEHKEDTSGLPGIFASASSTLEGGFTEEERQGNTIEIEGTSGIINQTNEAIEKANTPKEEQDVIIGIFEETSSEEVVKAVRIALNVIKNIGNYSNEDRETVRNILYDLGKIGYSKIGDFIEALDKKASQLAIEEEEGAESILRTIINKVANMPKGDTENTGSPREDKGPNTRAGIVSTINFIKLKEKYPNSPLITYYNNHKIIEYLQNNDLYGKEILFATDNELTNTVVSSMGEAYNVSNDGPLVLVVQDDKGTLDIDGVKYQPLGILPSTKPGNHVLNEVAGGMERLGAVRNLVPDYSKKSIVKKPNGDNITTTTYGKKSGINARAKDENYRGENITVLGITERNLDNSEKLEWAGKSKEEIRKTDLYKKKKKSFLNRLEIVIQESTGRKQLSYKQDNRKGGHNNIFLFVSDVSKTTSSTSEDTIDKLFKEGKKEQVLTFNSRTRRASNAIYNLIKFIREISNTIVFEENEDGTYSLDQETSATISQIEKIFSNNISDHLSFYNNQSWSYKIDVTLGEEGNTVVSLSLTQEDGDTIVLSENIYNIAEENISDYQYDILRRMFMDENGNLRMANDKDAFVKWNVIYSDMTADGSVANAYDDNILEARATAFDYDISSVTINIPSILDNKPTFPQTQGGEGQQDTSTGTTVDPETGIVLEEGKDSTNEKIKMAEAIVKIIEQASSTFELSEDERFYIDKKTGKSYLRVTSVIAADAEAGNRFDPNNPFALPSSNIGTGIDELVRDFFLDKTWHLSIERAETHYPNASGEDLKAFLNQLKQLKYRLEAKGLTIVPRNIIAKGTIPIKDANGNTQQVNIAGTIDLLAYDAYGNFYIIDMKSMRNTSQENKEHNKDKWSRQLSIYKDLLEREYGIKIKGLHIMPIKVNYPDPSGFNNSTLEYGLKYPESATDYSNPMRAQLTIDGEDFKGAKPELEDFYDIPYKETNVAWDKLQEYEKEAIQNAIMSTENTQTDTSSETGNIQNSEIANFDTTLGLESFNSMDSLFEDNFEGIDFISSMEDRQTVIPAHLEWNNLDTNVKENLQAKGITQEMWSQMSEQEMDKNIKCSK